MDSGFPDKLFYRIGDVSEITGIKPHILRYWEAEFSVLHPRKNEAGQRVYERRDVELIMEIKTLLYEQRYTISGAKKFLARQHRRVSRKSPTSHASGDLSEALKMCRRELHSLLALLDKPKGKADQRPH
jgi:DNA-binding transcriptional MerR regulator